MSNLMRPTNREMLSLRDAMDHLFEESFVRFGDAPLGFGQVGLPAINLMETDNEVVVKAVLPGLKPEEVDITLLGDVLTLRGQRSEQPDDKQMKGNWHRLEWRHSAFERSVSLPCRVDADHAQTHIENGVLTLTLPKAEDVKPKRIQIKAKNGNRS